MQKYLTIMTDLEKRFNHQTTVHDEPIFKLKIPETEKYKHKGRWFKDYINYLIPYDSTVVDDYKAMKLSYDIINNNIEGYMDELQSFCSPMGEEESLEELKRERIYPFNKIPEKANIYSGELIKRQDNHKVILTNHKELIEKNNLYKGVIRKSIEEEVGLNIEITRMRYGGATEREIQEYINQYKTQKQPEDINRKDFQTDWEIFNTRALRYAEFDQDLANKRQLTIKHAITSDRVFLYVNWKHGKPVIDVINPLYFGFHKSPDVERIEKGDYAWHKTPVTIADVYNEFGEELSPEEINRLGVYSYSPNTRVDKRHNIKGRAKKVFNSTTEEMLISSDNNDDKTVGQAMGQGINYRYNNTRLLWKTHIEFKAFREIVFITYTDEMGVEITDILDSKFEIPKTAEVFNIINKFGNKSKKYKWSDDVTGVSYTAEKIWIPRRYEVTRLGEDVYVRWREVPNQPLNLSNPYEDFELSYKGRIFSNVNSTSISQVQRAIPFQFQYFIVKMIQMRELGKYQGYTMDIDVDQIPDYLMMDHNGEPIPGRDKIAIWRLYLKKLGYNFYSGSQSANGLPPSTRSPGSKSNMTGTAIELINLQQFLEFIDREIGMQMGISPERQANFTRGTNVTDNQQSIIQSHSITEPIFYMHSQVWKHALNDWLKLFRKYSLNIFEENPGKTEHFLEYVTPNNARELLKITPEILQHDGVGLYLGSSGQDQFYRNTMIQMVHAFGQNAGEGMEVVSSMVKAIASGESPEEIHKMIQLESERQSLRQQQLSEIENQRAKEALNIQTEWREDEQRHDIDKINTEGKWALKEKAMDVYKLQDGLNQDEDGIPDHIESMLAVHKIQKENIELGQKEKELAITEKKNQQDKDIKEKDLEVKRLSAAKKITSNNEKS